MLASTASIVFCALVGVAVAFQLALALGAPWGAYAMGGKFPGKLPPPMRVAAVVQAVVLAGLAIAVRAHVMGGTAPRWVVWVAVAVSSASLLMNSLTPSRGERLLWAPLAFLMLASSLAVALG